MIHPPVPDLMSLVPQEQTKLLAANDSIVSWISVADHVFRHPDSEEKLRKVFS